jgi:hypothetical protein
MKPRLIILFFPIFHTNANILTSKNPAYSGVFVLWRLVSQVLFLDNNLSKPSYFGTRGDILITSHSEVAAGRIAWARGPSAFG